MELQCAKSNETKRLPKSTERMTSNIAFYNTDHAVVEAELRSNPQGFVANAEYLSLAQLQTPDEFCSALATITGISIPAIASSSDIRYGLLNKLAETFRDLLPSAEGRLLQFLLLLRTHYVLSNAFILISAALKGRAADSNIRFHPIGIFQNLELLVSIENLSEIVGTLLEASPAGPFLIKAGLDVESTQLETMAQQDIEILRAKAESLYLEHLLNFSLSIGGQTAETMNDLLYFEADRMTIMLVFNLLGNEDFTPEAKMEMMPRLGVLYPYHQERLSQCSDMDSVRSIISEFQEYKRILDRISADPSLTLLDAFMFEQVDCLRDGFKSQYDFGSIYCYFKLKELEVNNLVWMYEALQQNQTSEMRKYVPVI